MLFWNYARYYDENYDQRRPYIIFTSDWINPSLTSKVNLAFSSQLSDMNDAVLVKLIFEWQYSILVPITIPITNSPARLTIHTVLGKRSEDKGIQERR